MNPIGIGSAVLRRAVVGGAFLLALSGCSTIDSGALDGGRPDGPPELLASDDSGAPLPETVGVEEVRAAIEYLKLPQPVTMAHYMEWAPGTEVVDTVMIDPSSTVKWVSVDHTAMAAALSDEFEGAAEVEGQSDADETMLPALAAIGGSGSVATDYVIDGETLWFRVDDFARAERAEIDTMMALFPDEDLEAEDFIMGPPNPDEWEGRWSSMDYYEGAQLAFPPGLGADLSVDDALEALISAGVLEGDVVGGSMESGALVPDITVTEVGRTDGMVLVEVDAPNPRASTVLLGIDGDGRIRQIEVAGRRMEFQWSVDPTLMVLPPADLHLKAEETAAWLFLDPECVDEDMSIADSIFSVDIDCSLADETPTFEEIGEDE